MKRIVITIEDGQLTGVYNGRDDEDVLVDVVDYDNIRATDDADYAAFSKEVEEEIRTGKLKPCW